MTIQRCSWCSNDRLYISYHDEEWGKVEQDENRLFEMLCLEGQQAGLSWITVLKKRENYRSHFFHYPITKIAEFTDDQLEDKLSDAGLIRHLGKLKAIETMQSHGSNSKMKLVMYLIGYGTLLTIRLPNNDVIHYRDAPAQTEISQKLSKTLKKRGFKFVGPTTCYAFMQAVGMVNDHENHCHFK